MKRPLSCCFLQSILFVSLSAWAQSPQTFKPSSYEVEAGTILSTTSTTPFWIRSNQYGEVPLESQLFTLRGQVRREYDSTSKFSYGYGARIVLNAGANNQVLLPELYAKVRYRVFEFYAGRRREIVGLVDTTLTSGSYAWSGNALPIPKVELSIPNYTPVLFKNKILSIKGQFSHGWFGSGDSTSKFFLHQKSFYVRLGKPDWRFKFYGGLNHQAQWGGRPTVPFYDNIQKVMVEQFGSNFEAYLNVVLGLPIDYNTRRFKTGGQVYGEGNRLGNHLGSVDIALEYEGKNSRWLLYRQSIYDDGTLFFLTNIGDGLSGISWTSRTAGPGIKRIAVEYLQTSNQGGPYSARAGVQYLRGQDNYFNNGIYNEGWVYQQQTIGTPFLMPLRNSTGITSDERLLGVNPKQIVNNRVEALTVSALSQIRNVELMTRVSTSKNLGNYVLEYPISLRQLSLQQQVSFPFRKYTASAILAYDSAGLLEENLGLLLLLKRSF